MPRTRNLLLFVAFGLLLGAAAIWYEWRVGLPQTDGRVVIADLGAPVDIPRDRAGVPTVIAAERMDAARALGFLHGQERFFQMDLLRRSAAGELAELLGATALPHDRKVRLHRFRARAATQREADTASAQALLDAYTSGVNAGLTQLARAPVEYRLLRQRPRPWHADDSVLVQAAMYLQLQGDLAENELDRVRLIETFGADLLPVLYPQGTRWDAALDGSNLPIPDLPGIDTLDLRSRSASPSLTSSAQPWPSSEGPALGSNQFAVAAAHGDGAAWLAGDMHLGLSLPNIWYRVRLRYVSTAGLDVDAIGMSLPGTPALIAGSNGHIAWSFTNSYGDYADRVIVHLDPEGRLQLADGRSEDLQRHEEIVHVRGGTSESLLVEESRYGPMLPASPGIEERHALLWAAHQKDGINAALDTMVEARDLRQAVQVCQRSAVATQNVVIADRSGAIGWTICGRVPQRRGYSGELPVDSAIHPEPWDGWVPGSQLPKRLMPREGRLWGGNARMVGGAELAMLGDGGYALPVRAQQLRDRLREHERHGAAELLAIQLDTEARWFGYWQEHLSAALERLADQHEAAQEALQQLQSWNGHAAADSAGYALIRRFRTQVHQRTLAPFLAVFHEQFADARAPFGPRVEELVRRLLDQQPEHLLAAEFSDWQALADAAARATLDQSLERYGSLQQLRWSGDLGAEIAHPLAAALPWAARWLRAPGSERLSGDLSVPRVQGARVGASQRMVVSPGREQEGIYHMPGGQSGHPASPWFLDGHEDWLEGRPTPLLPGRERHRLVLVPKSD